MSDPLAWIFVGPLLALTIVLAVVVARHGYRSWKWERGLMNEHKKVKGWDDGA